MNIYDAVLQIKDFCGVCGSLMLKDETPLEFTNFDDHFNEMFENDLMNQKICICCQKNKKRPFLWIGQLPNYYIFKTGQIYSFSKRKIITPFIDSYGYPTLKIYLGIKNFKFGKIEYKRINLRIHKINILAHKPLYAYQNLVIRHDDDNKLNTDIENLIWGTQKENMADLKRNKNKRKMEYAT